MTRAPLVVFYCCTYPRGNLLSSLGRMSLLGAFHAFRNSLRQRLCPVSLGSMVVPKPRIWSRAGIRAFLDTVYDTRWRDDRCRDNQTAWGASPCFGDFLSAHLCREPQADPFEPIQIVSDTGRSRLEDTPSLFSFFFLMLPGETRFPYCLGAGFALAGPEHGARMVRLRRPSEEIEVETKMRKKKGRSSQRALLPVTMQVLASVFILQ